MTTRDDLPKPVEATFPSILDSLLSLQRGFRKMGFGMQAEQLQGSILALKTLQQEQEAKGASPVVLATGLPDADVEDSEVVEPTG